MKFWLSTGWGDTFESPSIDAMRACLASLDPKDAEHGAAWLSDEADNSLEFDAASGSIAFARGSFERHLRGVTAERVLNLWIKLAAGRLDELEAEPWLPGARAPLAPDERARREREFAQIQSNLDWEFLNRLGDERAEIPCRFPGCGRGSVAFSAFCKYHHFENVMGRPAPTQ